MRWLEDEQGSTPNLVDNGACRWKGIPNRAAVRVPLRTEAETSGGCGLERAATRARPHRSYVCSRGRSGGVSLYGVDERGTGSNSDGHADSVLRLLDSCVVGETFFSHPRARVRDRLLCPDPLQCLLRPCHVASSGFVSLPFQSEFASAAGWETSAPLKALVAVSVQPGTKESEHAAAARQA